MTKDELLVQIQRDRHALLKTLDGVPDEAFAQPAVGESLSVVELLAEITAWDGEMLRRIAFAKGDSSQPPHDVTDESYWQAWSEQQVALKQIMGPRGIKVDLAGTWVRLLSRIEALSPLDYAHWLEIDPYVQQRRDLERTAQLRQWRIAWEQSLPWWQKLWRRWANSGQ